MQKGLLCSMIERRESVHMLCVVLYLVDKTRLTFINPDGMEGMATILQS